jgi:hypothetical protein
MAEAHLYLGWKSAILYLNKKSCEFKKEAYRDSIKRKGDKIGME